MCSRLSVIVSTNSCLLFCFVFLVFFTAPANNPLSRGCCSGK